MTALDRRDFTRLAGSALALAGNAPLRALAQGGAPAEGRDFKELRRRLPTSADGKIEVIAFFWYGCPHCFAFEPELQAWTTGLPADVRFRRVPVGFDRLKKIHARVYYTWEAMGVLDRMHTETFQQFHVQHKAINSEADIMAFAHDRGLDPDKARQAWNSFSVQARAQQAGQLTDDYGIDLTPEMGIQGRFVAIPARGTGGMLRTTEWLVDRLRKGA